MISPFFILSLLFELVRLLLDPSSAFGQTAQQPQQTTNIFGQPQPAQNAENKPNPFGGFGASSTNAFGQSAPPQQQQQQQQPNGQFSHTFIVSTAET